MVALGNWRHVGSIPLRSSMSSGTQLNYFLFAFVMWPHNCSIPHKSLGVFWKYHRLLHKNSFILCLSLLEKIKGTVFVIKSPKYTKHRIWFIHLIFFHSHLSSVFYHLFQVQIEMFLQEICYRSTESLVLFLKLTSFWKN